MAALFYMLLSMHSSHTLSKLIDALMSKPTHNIWAAEALLFPCSALLASLYYSLSPFRNRSYGGVVAQLLEHAISTPLHQPRTRASLVSSEGHSSNPMPRHQHLDQTYDGLDFSYLSRQSFNNGQSKGYKDFVNAMGSKTVRPCSPPLSHHKKRQIPHLQASTKHHLQT